MLERLTAIYEEYKRLQQCADELTKEIEQLEGQGITSANVYWIRKNDPDGKPDQLELTHPIGSQYYRQNGTRREYVGVKPEKIAAALASIDRFEQHQQLKTQHRRVVSQINSIKHQVNRLEMLAFGKQISFLDAR